MNVKQITIKIAPFHDYRARLPRSGDSQAVVYSPEGECVSGDEAAALKLAALDYHYRDIMIEGFQGESINATHTILDRNGNNVGCGKVQGSPKSIRDIMRELWPELGVYEPSEVAHIPLLLRHSYRMCVSACS